MRTLLEKEHRKLNPKSKDGKFRRYDVKLGKCRPYVDYKITRIVGNRGIKRPANKLGLYVGTKFRVISNNPPQIKILKNNKIIVLTDNNLGAGMSKKFKLNIYCRRVAIHERSMYQ